MYDIRHHELMISFLRKRLAEMPHGSFGTCRGQQVVYVTYDPAEAGLSQKNKKRYLVDSEHGRIWSPLIADSIQVEKQLRELTDLWHMLYRFEPRQINYPLIRKASSLFTESFFNNAVENANPTPIEHPVYYKGKILRSKNEMLGCEIIEKYGLPYKIEIAVGNDPFNMLYPDITVLIPYQQRCIGFEINGALSILKYANKTVNRHSSYIEQGLMISKDVVFVDIADRNNFYAELFETQLKTAIYAGLDDIVFPMGYVDDLNRVGQLINYPSLGI
ncbi:MAG: hypothetical protein J6Z43_02055 [Clostridiales bacterium]|nr:hypothetical protein [Clostridiales bacterium]